MEEKKKQQVAIYVRVSTDKQEVENQLIQLREYCTKSNYEIFKEYADVISGKERSRPAYDQMYKDAHKRMFDVLLFWDISRFSRSGTLYTLQKLKELENLQIEWESYQEQYFRTTGAFKDVLISMMATIAKIEREKISERTKAGLARVLKEKGFIKRRGKDLKPRKRTGYYNRGLPKIKSKPEKMFTRQCRKCDKAFRTPYRRAKICRDCDKRTKSK